MWSVLIVGAMDPRLKSYNTILNWKLNMQLCGVYGMNGMNRNNKRRFCTNVRNGLAEQYGCLAICIIATITVFLVLRLIS